MHRKLAVIFILLVLVTGMTAAIAKAHGDMPKVLVIDKVQNKKAPVTLSHDKHGDEFGCQACHHSAEGDIKPQSCFNCHGKDPNAPDPASGKKDNPFHITCKGCHKEKGMGPVKCGECHKN